MKDYTTVYRVSRFKGSDGSDGKAKERRKEEGKHWEQEM